MLKSARKFQCRADRREGRQTHDYKGHVGFIQTLSCDTMAVVNDMASLVSRERATLMRRVVPAQFLPLVAALALLVLVLSVPSLSDALRALSSLRWELHPGSPEDPAVVRKERSSPQTPVSQVLDTHTWLQLPHDQQLPVLVALNPLRRPTLGDVGLEFGSMLLDVELLWHGD